MTALNRCKALAVVAAVPVAATVAAIPALAGEDAELLRLWEEFKAADAECEGGRRA